MKTSVSDATYRNIWNECIREEFVDDGSGYTVDPPNSRSSLVDSSQLAACTCLPPCHRGLCRKTAMASLTSYGDSSSSVVSFAFIANNGYSPNPIYGPRTTSIFRGKVEHSSPTISVAELGDILFAKSSPQIGGKASIPPSPCSSPASSHDSLPSTSRSRQTYPVASMSEEEFEDEMASASDSSECEDEYMPSRPTHSRSNSLKQPSFASKQAAVARSGSPPRTRSSGTRPTARKTPKHAKKTSVSKKPISQRSKPRAKQVDASVPFIVPDDFRCLHCEFEQTNHRLQDFKRHVTAHFRSIIYWDCCGVPVSEAADYGIDGRSPAIQRDGVMVLGGCGRNFGRKDAYKRHLDDPNNRCVGDIDASWHPGNAYKDFGDD
ncbi:hypothetical protein EIP86_003690 [Pleurotus ostreatoroseus]|nr:hypothetical protein EIP86_003690 [Pleurotus ostreatoroseus]